MSKRPSSTVVSAITEAQHTIFAGLPLLGYEALEPPQISKSTFEQNNEHFCVVHHIYIFSYTYHIIFIIYYESFYNILV